ncbi:MAG: hypothetical protein U1B78_03470, partial [Dehalococcoidia bacterium]|nr:hypothetical protein [Dehalococcoidia bacterium]
MRVPNRVVLLTVSMVVLAGLLSAAAAFFYTRNVISDYDATVKREVEEKARAYGSASSVFLDALGPDALPVVQGLLTSIAEGETVASTESQALHNAFLSFEFWLPD